MTLGQPYPEAPEYLIARPLDSRTKMLARAAAHFFYAMAGAFKAFGKALEEFAS